MKKIDVYLEVGSKRTFASAIEWPGWCRAGKDQAIALQKLFEYAPRYERILRPARLGLDPPTDTSAFVVVERLKGNAATDFGASNLAPTLDSRPVADTELHRLQSILTACWRAFDRAVEKARGKTLRKGPRGGGRTVTGIVEHVLGAEGSYLRQLGGKLSESESSRLSKEKIREIILTTLADSAHGEIEKVGPRGGKRWSPRYFVRRDSWHILDHLWEIEDRQI